MITESYEKPIDRPSVIWCRTCAKYKDHKPKTTKDGNKWPPANLKTWCCNECCSLEGCMVYQYEVPDPPPEIKIEPWKPKCENPSCDGTCNNVACMPPDYQLQKVVHEKHIEIVKEKYFPWYEILLSAVGLYYIVSTLIHLIFV